MLYDNMISEGLMQINTMKNSTGATLDLVYMDAAIVTTDMIRNATHVLSILDNHHPPFEIELSIPGDCQWADIDIDTERLNYRLINFDELKLFLANQDWSTVIDQHNVNDTVEAFTSVICSWLHENVPTMRPPAKPPWSNRLLRRLKRNKNRALKRYRLNRNQHNRLRFNVASSNYQRFNASCYHRYVQRAQVNLRSNPKAFWSFVNSKRKDSGFPASMYVGHDSADTTSSKVDLFASHFASVFSQVAPQSEADKRIATNNVPIELVALDIFDVTNEMIARATKRLKSSYAAGPDGIPSVILKKCSAELSDPLAVIFNRSLSTGTFPAKWKQSFMFPIFKKGDKRNVANYRGITSLCSTSKLMELVIHEYMFFRCKNYISFDQHGFYPGRSVSTNLLQFSSMCLTQMENHFQVDAVYTDLKAAFDRVDRELLLAKLTKLGATDRFVAWLRSYLYERTFRVKLGSCSSRAFSSASGVPQGSTLGPLLFSIFINDVCSILPEGCRLLYADDVKIYFVVKSINDCHLLQQILNSFAHWCDCNRIEISLEKCSVISFTRRKSPMIFNYTLKNHDLQRVSTVKDLGVTLDTKLDFNAHRAIVVQKANRQLGFIKRISSEFTDTRCLRSLYCSLVRPILEHASVVWAPFHAFWIDRIEQVQKRFVQFALQNLHWRDPQIRTPYHHRCRLLTIDTLHTRRKVGQAVFAAKVLRAEVDSPYILAQLQLYAPERSLRDRGLVSLSFHRTDYGRFEPISHLRSVFSAAIDHFELEDSSTTFRMKLITSGVFDNTYS